MKQTFTCNCCGHCCLNLIDAYNGCVSDADLERWRRLGRDDLLVWVKTLDLGPGNKLHTAWVDPETGDDVERCPWLLDLLDQKGHICGINDVNRTTAGPIQNIRGMLRQLAVRGVGKPVIRELITDN